MIQFPSADVPCHSGSQRYKQESAAREPAPAGPFSRCCTNQRAADKADSSSVSSITIKTAAVAGHASDSIKNYIVLEYSHINFFFIFII